MNILVFYQYFGTPAGSWSTRMYELTRRWVKKGHCVTVVTSPYEKSDIRANGYISRQVIEGVNIIIINSADSNRDAFVTRAIKALRFSLTSCRMALTEPCDIVIASSGPITVGIPALVAKWFRRKKMVFEIRDLWPQGAIEMGKIKNSLLKSIATGFEKLCYRNASLVVACSPGMEESVNRRFPATKTIVISNASDPELFDDSQHIIPTFPFNFENKSIFVYAGSLGLMDDAGLLVRAMQLIQDDSIHAIIIGDGAEKKELEELTAQMKLKNVHFFGLLPKTEVVFWLKKSLASLVLFKNYPVLQTSSPNKLFDAFAAGLPVIHNTNGWISDLVNKEHCGATVSAGDPMQLAQVIQRIATDTEYRKSLAENAARLGREDFNRDRLSEIYLEALLRI